MGFQKVLVPYDNSEHAQNALLKAIELFDDPENAKLYVIEVLAPPHDLVYSSLNRRKLSAEKEILSQEMFTELINDRNDKETKDLQTRVKPFVQDFKGEVKIETIYGIYIVDTIIDTAKQYDVDVICMGSRGLGAIRGMIGSVSYGILRSSDLPVLIVK